MKKIILCIAVLFVIVPSVTAQNNEVVEIEAENESKSFWKGLFKKKKTEKTEALESDLNKKEHNIASFDKGNQKGVVTVAVTNNTKSKIIKIEVVPNVKNPNKIESVSVNILRGETVTIPYKFKMNNDYYLRAVSEKYDYYAKGKGKTVLTTDEIPWNWRDNNVKQIVEFSDSDIKKDEQKEEAKDADDKAKEKKRLLKAKEKKQAAIKKAQEAEKKKAAKEKEKAAKEKKK